MGEDLRGGNLKRWGLIGLGVAVFAVQAKQARDAYDEQAPPPGKPPPRDPPPPPPSSGSKPIEGVGTAVAAFCGLLPAAGTGRGARGGDLKRSVFSGLGVAVLLVRAKRARDAYVEEVSTGNKPIEGVGTAVAAFVGLLPTRRRKGA